MMYACLCDVQCQYVDAEPLTFTFGLPFSSWACKGLLAMPALVALSTSSGAFIFTRKKERTGKKIYFVRRHNGSL